VPVVATAAGAAGRWGAEPCGEAILPGRGHCRWRAGVVGGFGRRWRHRRPGTGGTDLSQRSSASLLHVCPLGLHRQGQSSGHLERSQGGGDAHSRGKQCIALLQWLPHLFGPMED